MLMMTDPNYTQVGISVTIVILMLREILPIITRHNKSSSGGWNGYGTLSRDNKEAINLLSEKVQTKDNCVQIVKRIEGEFRSLEVRDDERKKYQDAQFDRIEQRVNEVKKLVNNGNT
jgi:hypothetical protein